MITGECSVSNEDLLKALLNLQIAIGELQAALVDIEKAVRNLMENKLLLEDCNGQKCNGSN